MRLGASRTGRAGAVSVRSVLVAAAIVPVGVLTSASHAWLGSFEVDDGYQDFLNMVQNYNAGQYGINSGYGPGVPTPITPNTGLWQAIDGGFYTGSAVSYVTGHFANDRQWVNNGIGSSAKRGLMLTTGHEGFGGPALKYKYNVDQYDLGGVMPSATAGQTVTVSFWTRGWVNSMNIGGSVPFGYFGNEVAFLDSSGNVGFRLGVTARPGGDRVTYWNGSTLFESAIIAEFSRFDRWDITLDLATSKVSASYFQFSTSTLHTLLTSVPMETAMGNFTSMTFRSSPGISNAKTWAVDDFTLTSTIPGAPTALALLPAAILAGRRRRGG